MKAEYFRTIQALRRNDEIVTARPDKEHGVVITKKTDYIQKMLPNSSDWNLAQILTTRPE